MGEHEDVFKINVMPGSDMEKRVSASTGADLLKEIYYFDDIIAEVSGRDIEDVTKENDALQNAAVDAAMKAIEAGCKNFPSQLVATAMTAYSMMVVFYGMLDWFELQVDIYSEERGN